jgi:pimeloyl-ACP methyl ester carboxylesterase
MKTISQDQFSEPANLDEVVDQSIVVHHRNGGSATRIVIFVHGLGGSRYGKNSTWSNFPKFIFEDVSDLDIGLYQYETLWRRLRFGAQVPLDREAKIFADTLRDELARYRDIILVGHSMGGVLCKAVITRLVHDGRMDLLDRIAGLFLLASPQLGSLRVPPILSCLSPDADALKPHGALLVDIASTFEDHLLLDSHAIAYDKPVIPTFAVLGASDFWVDELSAGIGLPTRQRKVAVGTHTEVVKPRSKDSPVYNWVVEKLRDCLARFDHDVFLAMAMAGVDTEEKYQSYRNEALAIEKWLREHCGFRSVFYAGQDLKTKKEFEAEDFSLSNDLTELRASKYFMLVYPEKIASSVLFEAGLALALGKPSVYFIRDRRDLPFLMKKAEQADLPASVRIYEYENLARIEALLKNPGEALWKYLGDKPY